MIHVKESKEYYINSRALTFGENDLENPNRVAVSLVSGTVIMVYVKGTIDYAIDGNFERWTLKGYSTKLAANTSYYIYARLSRTSQEALIIFSSNLYAFDGSINGDDTSIPSTAYWYVRIGYLTETDGISLRQLTYDSGTLGTNKIANEANDLLSKAFVFHFDDQTNPDKLTSIQALAGLWTDSFLSAKGVNPNGGGSSEGGATTLGGLSNVTADADRTYDAAKMLVLEADSNLWTLKNLSELVGLDEDALLAYLTTNNYAKKSDIPSLSGYATEQWVLGKGYATTSDLDARIDALVNGAPQAYDTLKEIADVLSKNVDSIDDILTALGTKVSQTDFDAIVANLQGGIDGLWARNSYDKLYVGHLSVDSIGAESITGDNVVATKIQIGDGTIEWDATNNGFKVTGGLYTESYLSAKGANSSGGSSSGGGLITSLYRYADLGKTFSDTNNDTFNAYTINKINTDLGSRISVLEGKATNVSFTQSLTSGTQIGSISIDGVAKNIYAPTIPTSLKNPYSLTINNSGGTAQVSYDGSAAKSLTLTKTMVGLGSVENTALSTWAGTNKITTLGTITTGVWNGTKIANGYLANSAITIAGTSVSLGGSITAATLQSNLGLGSFAYKSSLAFADLTNKPTTLSGYGITDAMRITNNTNYLNLSMPTDALSQKAADTYIECYDSTGGWWNWKAGKWITQGGKSSQFVKGDGSLDGTAYLPLSGGTITSATFGALEIKRNSASGNSGIKFLNNTELLGILGVGGSASSTYAYNPIFYDKDSNVYTLIHSGNIGSQSVASAAKLTTARSIWGQSFDGTKDITGRLYLSNEMGVNAYDTDGIALDILRLSSGNILTIGYGTAGAGCSTLISGYNITLRYGTNRTNGLMLNSSGNVGIGTTSPSYKLHVNGTLNATTLYQNGVTMDSIIDGYVTALQGGIDGLWNRNEYDELFTEHLMSDTIAANAIYTDRLSEIYFNGSNVGIGTSSATYKLHVSGTMCASGAVTLLSTLSVSNTIYSGTGIYTDGYVSAKGQNTSSDMRLKNVLNDVVLNVSDIANAPSIRFAWKNGGGVDVGSSAQYWQKLLPDAVKERDGHLEMQYANIALLSAIAIAKRMETHEERIARLEKENSELRLKIERLQINN